MFWSHLSARAVRLTVRLPWKCFIQSTRSYPHLSRLISEKLCPVACIMRTNIIRRDSKALIWIGYSDRNGEDRPVRQKKPERWNGAADESSGCRPGQSDRYYTDNIKRGKYRWERSCIWQGNTIHSSKRQEDLLWRWVRTERKISIWATSLYRLFIRQPKSNHSIDSVSALGQMRPCDNGAIMVISSLHAWTASFKNHFTCCESVMTLNLTKSICFKHLFPKSQIEGEKLTLTFAVSAVC